MFGGWLGKIIKGVEPKNNQFYKNTYDDYDIIWGVGLKNI